jgi:hypothetical protein
MGVENIRDNDLANLDIIIEEKKPDGDRTLKIPQEKLSQYVEIIKGGLDNGFWNETIGTDEILFIFKLRDGSIREYKLSPDNEREVDKLCAELNNEPMGKTSNVYKYLSKNKFYHAFMLEHYADLVNR